MMLLLHAWMTEASHNSSCWNMALHVPLLLRCWFLMFLCKSVQLLSVKGLTSLWCPKEVPASKHCPNHQNSNHNPSKKPVEKQGQLRMTVWLWCTWPEVELLLNGAVGSVSGQFESVFDSLMPLLEQRWGVVLSLAGCRRAESRAWHVYYNTFQCGPVGPGLPKNLLYRTPARWCIYTAHFTVQMRRIKWLAGRVQKAELW